MIDVSLTHFVDFATKAGMSQLSAVKNIKAQKAEGYAPYKDFYKTLREGIIEFHQSGSKDKKELDKICDGLTDRKKQTCFPTMIRGYKKFLGKKEFEWFVPKKTDWVSGNLMVAINPELGLHINGEAYLIKLYFKGAKHELSQRLCEPILHLMGSELKSSKAKMAVLDVWHNKFFELNRKIDPLILLMLEAQASSFVKMWEV